MDLDLIIWILVFIGGYGAVLGYLLRIAMRQGPPGGSDSGR